MNNIWCSANSIINVTLIFGKLFSSITFRLLIYVVNTKLSCYHMKIVTQAILYPLINTPYYHNSFMQI